MSFNLAAVKRRRRRGPSEEGLTQRALFDLLPLRVLPGTLYWHTPNGGSRHVVEAVNLKRQGVVAGVPDVFLFRIGQLYALELKAKKKGRRSPAQIAFQAALVEQGCKVATVYSLDEAIAQLEAWGLLFTGRHSVREIFTVNV